MQQAVVDILTKKENMSATHLCSFSVLFQNNQILMIAYKVSCLVVSRFILYSLQNSQFYWNIQNEIYQLFRMVYQSFLHIHVLPSHNDPAFRCMNKKSENYFKKLPKFIGNIHSSLIKFCKNNCKFSP